MKKRIIIISISAFFLTFIIIAFQFTSSFNGENPVRIYIPADASSQSIRDTLTTRLGNSFGTKTFLMWKVFSGDPSKANGSYVISPNQKLYSFARNIAHGRQTPLKVTVSYARTVDEYLDKISKPLQLSSDDLIHVVDSILKNNPEYTDPREFPFAFIPDTYEFYWTDSPERVMNNLLYWHDRFWNEERCGRAASLGLTPLQVTVIASIVEEESNRPDEHPIIARLYLNRLAKGMKLQADPTVKFAVGDFSLRRITASHLAVDSPYNTYKISGLPPGPIRIPQKSTIDAVLNAPEHDYLYMCAREDFSGRHNFAVDYATHLRNARRYTDALNRMGIH